MIDKGNETFTNILTATQVWEIMEWDIDSKASFIFSYQWTNYFKITCFTSRLSSWNRCSFWIRFQICILCLFQIDCDVRKVPLVATNKYLYGSTERFDEDFIHSYMKWLLQSVSWRIQYKNDSGYEQHRVCNILNIENLFT